MRLLLFTLLSISLLVGCTITKRHFGPGYHVEWKKAYSGTEKEDEKEKPANFRDDRSVVTESSIIQQIDSVNSNTKQEETLSEETVLDEVSSHKSVETETIKTTLERIEKKTFFEKDEAVDEKQQRTEPLTWVSLILFVGIGVSAGLISMYSSFLYLGAGLFLSGLAVVFFVFALISFIRVQRHPERYKNKGLTTLMFLFAACSLIVSAVYLLFVSAMESMGQIM